jgi:hypothetical protein
MQGGGGKEKNEKIWRTKNEREDGGCGGGESVKQHGGLYDKREKRLTRGRDRAHQGRNVEK